MQYLSALSRPFPGKPAMLAAILLSFAGWVSAVTPNHIRKTTYSAPGTIENQSTAYSNGLGKVVQSQIHDGTADIVSGTTYDFFGRAYRSTKPFLSTTAGHKYLVGNPIDLANAWWDGSDAHRPLAGGFAYSETKFAEDPLDRPIQVGAPGAAFAIEGGHASRFWRFGINSVRFVANPTATALDAMANDADAKYFLEVSMDPNGKFTQLVKDNAGNVLRTWVDAGATSSGVIEGLTEYDVNGQPLRTMAPGEVNSGADGSWTTFANTAEGRVLEINSPDEGRVKTVYNRSGEVRFVQSERELHTNTFRATKYDAFGRPSEMGTVAVLGPYLFFDLIYADQPDFPKAPDPNYAYTVKLKNYYDQTASAFTELATPAFLQGRLFNLRGRLVATVAYDESGSRGQGNRVEEYYSYDAAGRVDKKYKIIPGVPIQQFIFTYDLQGKVLTKHHAGVNATGGTIHSTTWTYQYDARGRLSRILANNVALADYEYTQLGQLKARRFKKGAQPVADVEHYRNIRDWPSENFAWNANGTGLFFQYLDYDQVYGSTPQYNGNLGATTVFYPNKGEAHDLIYTYDGAGQLVATSGSPGFEETFSYDAKGRIKQMKEGVIVKGPYVYEAKTHKLSYVSNTLKGNALGNFVYDPSGNMVLDRSKKMSISYDWRGMPILFRFHASIPEQTLTWRDVETLRNLPGVGVTAEVHMMYDASGNRVWKKSLQF